jgi:periplasmic protein CpxP/Spy
MKMKGIRVTKTISVLASLLFLFAVIPVLSQDNPSGYGGGHRGRMMATPQDRTDHLSQALSLNDDQKAKVLSIYQDEDKQMSALRSNSDMSRQDKRTQMQQIHEKTDTQIKALLNPDQAQKYDAMQQQMSHHHKGGDNGSGGAPQQ